MAHYYFPCCRWLIDHNVSSQSIDKILEGGLTSEDLPHKDQNTWYVECERGYAETLLEHCPEGTFLIRPSRHEGTYALSLRHCKKQGDNKYVMYYIITDLYIVVKDRSYKQEIFQVQLKIKTNKT